ncbi:hypothetical protein [Pelagicoccus mobilis]|uniref:Uncharacterized protein n=1 Tax=Pelagicoccus mobilis TaxID=415221 RepID=A0A934VSS2_9BACT|nr:hypothetical protein [Pelagicoccus mobilis]MBK1878794.1 hypothetical protein [Pelagicoccus mobilis]
MKGSGRLRAVRAAFLSLALAFAGLGFSQGQPDWAFEILESKKAMFEADQLHAKEGDWLLTFRMRVKSLKMVPPISKIEFEGKIVSEEEDVEDEIVWTKSHTIRRKDFEAAYGGGRSQFVRVFLRDVPAEVTLVEMSYLKEEDSEEE